MMKLIKSGKVIMKKTNEVMSKLARVKMAMRMKSKGKQMARKRAITMKKKATPEKLKSRAYKKARSILMKKMLKDRDKSDLSISGKEALEKKLDKKKAVIAKIAKKILPQVKSAEAERLKKKKEE